MLTKVLKNKAAQGVAQKYTQKHRQGGGMLDVRFGFSLLRDKRIPLKSKAIALGIGIATLIAIELLEFPLETILATVLPFFGFAIDLFFDGVELFAWPILVSSLLLPHLAPKVIVEQIRAEKFGLPQPTNPS